jgi:hypothetical protein
MHTNSPYMQLVQKWNNIIAADPSGQPLIDLTIWLSRATLDVIGEGEGVASTATIP